MNIDLDYKSFCDIYYKAAEQVADITIAKHIEDHGPLNPAIDVELVKDLGVSYGLEKVFSTFDVDHESNAQVTTYMSRVVRNCVLTELGKESTAVGAKKRKALSFDRMQNDGTVGGRLEGFRDYIDSGKKYEKKEELIAQMLQCLKKLSGVDQVILRCWMLYPKMEYTDMVLDEIGWDNTPRKRNVVSVRQGRAVEVLRGMMDKAREDYLDIYDHAQKIQEHTPKQRIRSVVDYNFIRRRRRAAKKSITRGIDYAGLAKMLAARFPD